MSFTVTLSGAELRRRLVQRGLSEDLVNEAMMNRDKPNWIVYLDGLLG